MQHPRRRRQLGLASLVISSVLLAAGLVAPTAGASTRLSASATAQARAATLRAVSVVPGSNDPIAVTAALALQMLYAAQELAGPEYGISASDLRRQLATLVAPKAKVSVEVLDAAWAAAEPVRLVALYAALAQVGVAYRSYQSAPGYGFDCSGLTTYAWSVAGVNLPRTSGSQIAALKRAPLAEVKPGDILWYSGHVGLALGVGAWYVHSPNPGKTVEISFPRRSVLVGVTVAPAATAQPAASTTPSPTS